MINPYKDDDVIQNKDLSYFFNVNAIIFVLLVFVLDIVSIYLPIISNLVSLFLLYAYLNVPYYIYKDLTKRPSGSIEGSIKYLYLLISILPVINIVFSVIYGLRRRKLDNRASIDNLYRSDWRKGVFIGLAFLLISLFLPISVGGSGETIRQQINNTGPNMFQSLALVAALVHWPIIPTSIYFDRKYLETEQDLSIGKITNILSIIPYLSFFTGIIYIINRYIKMK